MYLLDSPLSVPVSKKKKFILNINNYRNAHHFTLNKAKINYKKIMAEQVSRLPKMQKIKAVFVLYPKTKRRTDTANVCSIHDKFIADAIVEAGKLPDDNYTHWIESTYKFGCVDKDNPRVEINIIDLS